MLYAIDYMQQMTPEMCEELPTPTATTTTVARDNDSLFANAQARGDGTSTLIPEVYLKDKRDEKSYVIRKLADGRCWMAQNITIYGEVTLSSSLSNVIESRFIPASSSGRSLGTESKLRFQSHTDNSTNSVGTMYNWCAATAGTCNDIINPNADAQEDICPRNWRMPIGGTTSAGTKNEYQLLYLAYNSNKSNFDAARGMSHTGYCDDASFNWNASWSSSWSASGTWWTATAYNNANAYNFLEHSTGVIAIETNYRRGGGLGVRCIAREASEY